VDQFRATIRGHTSSVEIHLTTLHLEATQLESSKRRLEHQSIISTIQEVSCRVMARLDYVSQCVSCSVLQGRTLLDTSAQVMNTTMQVFTMTNSIHMFICQIPGQIQRQQPIIFTDPFNAIRPFYLEFINSEEAFLDVLRRDFLRKRLRCVDA
jgi:hypothetical protein